MTIRMPFTGRDVEEVAGTVPESLRGEIRATLRRFIQSGKVFIEFDTETGTATVELVEEPEEAEPPA